MKVEVLTSRGKSFLWLYFGLKSADFLNCIIRFYFSFYKCRFSVFIAFKIKVSRTFKDCCCVARFVSKGFEKLFNLQSDFFRPRAGSRFRWKILFFMMSHILTHFSVNAASRFLSASGWFLHSSLLLLWPWYLLCYSDAEWFNSQNPNILISVWLSDFLSGRLCLVGPEDWSGVWGADRRSGQTLWLRTDPSGGRWRKCKHIQIKLVF